MRARVPRQRLNSEGELADTAVVVRARVPRQVWEQPCGLVGAGADLRDEISGH